MRWILLLTMLYVAAVVETSLVDVIRVGTVAPDLLALVAILWVLLGDGPRGFLVSGMIGLLGDLLAPGRPGLGMALLLLVGYGVTRVRDRLPLEHPACQVAVVWAGTTFFAIGLAFSSWLSGEASVSLATLLVRGLGVGIYTAGVALPILLVVGWTGKPLETHRKRLVDLKS